MLISIVIILFLLVLNGIFAMSELAMMTSRQQRLEQAAARGSKGAAEALKLAAEPTRFLSTVQVGITLIGIVAGAYGEKSLSVSVAAQLKRVPWLASYADLLAMLAVVLTITYLSLVLGELVPKRLALAFPEKVAALISRPLSVLSWLMALPVRVLTGSTELVLSVLQVPPAAKEDVSADDLREMTSRAASTGLLDPVEHEIVQRAFRIGDMAARTLMVPRSEVVWIDKNESGAMIRAFVGSNPYSHFPVCDGGLDNVIGVVHIKDMVAHGLLAGDQFNVVDLVRQPLHVGESMDAARLLERLRADRSHIAIVTDEYGGVAGIVTLNDISEALLGEIRRHGEDDEPDIVRRDDGSLLVDGRISIDDAAAAFGIAESAREPTPAVSTIAGVVMTTLGHVPKIGESVHWSGWKLEVVDMDANRIDRLLASKLPDPPAAGT